MLYLRILLVNLFVLVLLWTHRILPYFLLEYRVRCFNRLFVQTVCSPFQGVFIVLVRTTYIHLRNSIISHLFEDDVFSSSRNFFFFLIVLVRTAYIHTVSLLSENNVHPLKVPYCLFLLRTMYIHLRYLTVFLGEDDVHSFKESYRLFC